MSEIDFLSSKKYPYTSLLTQVFVIKFISIYPTAVRPFLEKNCPNEELINQYSYSMMCATLNDIFKEMLDRFCPHCYKDDKSIYEFNIGARKKLREIIANAEKQLIS